MASGWTGYPARGIWLRAAIQEIRRCRTNIASGGPAEFWANRLRAAAIEHEQTAEKLREAEKAIRMAMDNHG